MAICERCGKGKQHGHNVSFSKRRTNRAWNINIQKTTVVENGKTRRMRVCAQCIKTMSKSA